MSRVSRSNGRGVGVGLDEVLLVSGGSSPSRTGVTDDRKGPQDGVLVCSADPRPDDRHSDRRRRTPKDDQNQCMTAGNAAPGPPAAMKRLTTRASAIPGDRQMIARRHSGITYGVGTGTGVARNPGQGGARRGWLICCHRTR